MCGVRRCLLQRVDASAVCVSQVWISGSETTGEFRGQIYTPDYLHSSKPRPVIASAPASVGYGQSFSFRYANVLGIDRVVFNRLAGGRAGVQHLYTIIS